MKSMTNNKRKPSLKNKRKKKLAAGVVRQNRFRNPKQSSKGAAFVVKIRCQISTKIRNDLTRTCQQDEQKPNSN